MRGVPLTDEPQSIRAQKKNNNKEAPLPTYLYEWVAFSARNWCVHRTNPLDLSDVILCLDRISYR